MAAAGSSQGPISFSFTRSSRQKLTASVVDNEARQGEDREYLVGAEGKELLSVNPAPVSKPLVIPLIRTNKWSRPDKPQETGGSVVPQTEEDSVLSQAVKELIEESRRSQEDDSTVDQTLSIPLLMQNKVPDGLEDGDKVDVSLRPESAEAADYESVPVEQYGMAMLRGMGWKEGEGIGRTFKQDVKPLEQKLRPKGLGLGADRTALKNLEDQKPRKPPKPGEVPEEESKGLGKGSAVEIQSGAHKDLYGKVEGLDPDNSRAMVKLAISGKVVTVSQFALRLVSSSEYKKNAKDLSRLSKVNQAKKEREAKEALMNNSPENKPHRESSPESRKPKERSPQREKSRAHSPKKEKRRERTPEREQHRETSSNGRSREKRPRSPEREKEKKKNRAEPQGWLHRDLRVRFIDKHYKGGKYYNSKMLVEDVLSPRSCVCRTESGRLIDDIKQDMLETVIPKEEGDHVMVVMGQHRGQVGRILHRDKHKSSALVQLQGDQDTALNFSYDVICHYTGACDD
ncbi:G-patch domain and KOW motifs-containing protein [Bombina bombina]|uniref:G-patch domain and KOW motifs-containing protein n=1 Tax=Bombina bombina TaxID=8345 RepID=UPI00235AB974|nr:G-patch domain and KOW motifs-containing protein [Bombina bombina]